MSAREYDSERRSSVQISQNAKGEPQVTVKAYTHDYDVLEQARVKAVAVFKATVHEVRQ